MCIRDRSEHAHVLGVVQQASHADTEQAIAGALRVAPEWASMPFSERAAIFLLSLIHI